MGTGSLAIELTPLASAVNQSTVEKQRLARPARSFTVDSRLWTVNLALPLLHFLVHRVVPAGRAELLQFQPVLVLLLVLRRGVISVLTVAALQRDDFAHRFFQPSAVSSQRRSSY